MLRGNRRFGRIARLYLVFIVFFYLSFAVSATLMNLYLEALGVSRTFIGFFHAASQFGGLLLALPAIAFFDLIGRRAALVLGAALTTLVRAFTVITPIPELIVATEALSGFGTVLFGLASVSLLADASNDDNRASLYAVSDFTRTVAILIGSVAAGFLPALIAPLLQTTPGDAQTYQAVLLASFGVRLLAIVPLALIALQSPLAPTADDSGVLPEVRALRYLNPRVLMSQRRQVFAFAVPFMLIMLAEALVFTFFNLLLRDQFGASDEVIGSVIGLNALIGSGVALLAPAVAARLGYQPAIVWGTLLTAACIAVFGLSRSIGMGVLAVFVQVAASQISRVLYRTFVINASPREDYFITSTMLALAANIGPAIAPPVSGLIQEQAGYPPLFAASVALTAAAAMLFWGIARWADRASGNNIAGEVMLRSATPPPAPRTPLE